MNLPMRPTSQVAANEALALMTRKRRPLRLAHRARRARQHGEAVGQAGRARRAGLGQPETAAGPLDQRRADLLLQQPDLLRHRRLGDEKLLGRAREGQPPRHRLEGAQGIERG